MWTKPTAIEMSCGCEINMYAPAEGDRPLFWAAFRGAPVPLSCHPIHLRKVTRTGVSWHWWFLALLLAAVFLSGIARAIKVILLTRKPHNSGVSDASEYGGRSSGIEQCRQMGYQICGSRLFRLHSSTQYAFENTSSRTSWTKSLLLILIFVTIHQSDLNRFWMDICTRQCVIWDRVLDC